jgi:hypothetical protein
MEDIGRRRFDFAANPLRSAAALQRRPPAPACGLGVRRVRVARTLACDLIQPRPAQGDDSEVGLDAEVEGAGGRC